MLGDPILEEPVRHTHRDRASIVGQERGGLEPRIEAMAVHLGLDAGQDVFPDIARNHGQFARFRLTGRRGAGFGLLECRRKRRQIVLGGLSPAKIVHEHGGFSI